MKHYSPLQRGLFLPGFQQPLVEMPLRHWLYSHCSCFSYCFFKQEGRKQMLNICNLQLTEMCECSCVLRHFKQFIYLCPPLSLLCTNCCFVAHHRCTYGKQDFKCNQAFLIHFTACFFLCCCCCTLQLYLEVHITCCAHSL